MSKRSKNVATASKCTSSDSESENICSFQKARKKDTHDRRTNKFKAKWMDEYNWIRRTTKDCMAKCVACQSDFSIAHGGIIDVEKHMKEKEHCSNLDSYSKKESLSTFLITPLSIQTDIKEEDHTSTSEETFRNHTTMYDHIKNSANLSKINKDRNKKKRVRKITANWTSDMTFKLISEVEVREELWNYLIPTYKDRNLRESLWDEVAQAIELTRTEVSNKWNCVRNSFRMAYGRQNLTKNGHAANRSASLGGFYNSLMFLAPTLRVEAPKQSNLTTHLSSTSQDNPHNELEDIEDASKEPMSMDMDALKTVKAGDSWDVVGGFIAMNGRRYASNDPPLAASFRKALYKLVVEFEEQLNES